MLNLELNKEYTYSEFSDEILNQGYMIPSWYILVLEIMDVPNPPLFIVNMNNKYELYVVHVDIKNGNVVVKSYFDNGIDV